MAPLPFWGPLIVFGIFLHCLAWDLHGRDPVNISSVELGIFVNALLQNCCFQLEKMGAGVLLGEGLGVL